MTRAHLKSPHRSRRMPPWIAAEHLAGFLLGLALAGMAIDYGYQRPTQTLPPTPTLYTGP
ncbi:MAG: hypothetical protein ACO29V_07730 [Limnohabitans sp.]